MIRVILTIVLLQITFFAAAQNDNRITIGKIETLNSKFLNEKRTVWIYVPNMTSNLNNANSVKRYPVLYLLDGEAHFYSTVGMIQQLSQANGNGVLPEMIVVGIENTNRMRDMIPSIDKNKPNPFLEFITKELITYIDSNYNTTSYKTIVGHSLGGLTVMDLLANNPNSFNAYIAIDPSVWLNDEYFLNNLISLFKTQKMDGKRLYLATANSIPEGMSKSKLEKSVSDDTQHIRSLFKLGKFLNSNTNGLLSQQKFYQNEKHNTLPLISEYDGLRFIFDYFQLDANENDFIDSSDLIAVKLKKHYANVSEKMGYKNSAPEELINYLAYEALGKQHYNKAKALFELNIDWYPTSSNVYDSYGDYFLEKKDTLMAIKNFEKALQLKSSNETQRKLDQLKMNDNSKNSTVDLTKYSGLYVLENYNIPITLEIRDTRLFAKVPGQPDDEFVYLSENDFTVKGKQGYKVTFQMNADKPLSFVSVQPNGTFKAFFKNK